MFNYYSEKLALNTESSLFLMEQWNKALQDPRSIPQYDICEILEINRAQYALIELGDKIIILKDSPHSPPNQVRVNAGRGGCLYAELNSNLELHLGHELTEEYLRRRLGIYDKEEMCDFIEIWNNYYWGTKND